MSEWAEGSGSTWADLDGDPRIVAGAEVLVGQRRGVGFIEDRHRLIGKRTRVGSNTFYRRVDDGARLVDTSLPLWAHAARDLVCLRTADGELTEEGRALEWLTTRDDRLSWQSHDWTDKQTSPGMGEWLARAGITVVKVGEPRYFGVDRRRLAMALGREEPTAGERDARPIVAAELPASPPPAPEPVMCVRCGVQPIAGREKYGSSHCADCATEMDVYFSPAHVADPPADLSGERHLDALRAWQRRPMGTR